MEFWSAASAAPPSALPRPSTALSSRPLTAGHRPGTAGGDGLRPSTAGSRPGTSSGTRHLTSSTVTPPIAPNNGFSPQDLLSQERDRDQLLRILSSGRVEWETRLLLATETGDSTTVSRLLYPMANGDPVPTFWPQVDLASIRGLHGYTLLHHAAARGHSQILSEILRWHLPGQPADGRRLLQVLNDSGETPLHLAVYGGHLLVVHQLIDGGNDVNQPNNDGETPLFYAARRSMPAVIRLLIHRGADPTIRDSLGDLAIDQVTTATARTAFDFHISRPIQRPGTASGTYPRPGENPSVHFLPYDILLRIFGYLSVNDVLRSACVSTKWHQVSETESLWKTLGVRKWELALNNSLGLSQTATSSFYRPRSSRPPSGKSSRPPSGRSKYSG